MENLEISDWINGLVRAHAAEFDTALAETRGGKKLTHWMWYVFPQIAGFGTTANDKRYSVPTLAHAEAFLRHPVLGDNFSQIIHAARASLESSARRPKVLSLFDAPDHRKFVSSATLFGGVARRIGMTDIAADCEAGLAFAREDGMPECTKTLSFLKAH